MIFENTVLKILTAEFFGALLNLGLEISASLTSTVVLSLFKNLAEKQSWQAVYKSSVLPRAAKRALFLILPALQLELSSTALHWLLGLCPPPCLPVRTSGPGRFPVNRRHSSVSCRGRPVGRTDQTLRPGPFPSARPDAAGEAASNDSR